MKIMDRGWYALRAALALAQIEKEKPISVAVLAEQEHISRLFLEQIFFKLRKSGIVAAVRGPGGGFYLGRPPNEITIKDIFIATGEELTEPSCGMHSERCGNSELCLSHQVWNRVNKLVDDFFMNITLASILEGEFKQEKGGEVDGKDAENQ